MKTLDKIRENNISVMLLALTCFLFGAVIGFIWSPVKNGVTIGSNNNVNDKKSDEEECEYKEDIIKF